MTCGLCVARTAQLPQHVAVSTVLSKLACTRTTSRNTDSNRVWKYPRPRQRNKCVGSNQVAGQLSHPRVRLPSPEKNQIRITDSLSSVNANW